MLLQSRGDDPENPDAQGPDQHDDQHDAGEGDPDAQGPNHHGPGEGDPDAQGPNGRGPGEGGGAQDSPDAQSPDQNPSDPQEDASAQGQQEDATQQIASPEEEGGTTMVLPVSVIY